MNEEEDEDIAGSHLWGEEAISFLGIQGHTGVSSKVSVSLFSHELKGRKLDILTRVHFL